MEEIINFKNKIKNSNILLYIIIFLVIGFIVKIIPILIYSVFFDLPEIDNPAAKGYFYFFIAITFIPLFETFIFQHGIISLLSKNKFFKGKNILLILISAFIFGLYHWYNIPRIISMFFVGIILAYVYIDLKKDEKYPILYVSLLHALHNTIVFVLGKILIK
ncbi:MAG: CPBP family intramembrane metalloprotease [Candidatus Mcinerneyibacterium aminivorans]|uniref:CPBP family intramembrane metalloprotease n=1 Tax=Candidatus Mcinerneyibacterium aminivorans TaxID=2703815 RepID=A0A5D0MG30_9BACT|nr:MAG: CPBP family intramembrane metalloprotease [Candidatus Mcinerneyibacterium aminivorans]